MSWTVSQYLEQSLKAEWLIEADLKKKNTIVSCIAQVPALSPVFTKDHHLCQTTGHERIYS